MCCRYQSVQQTHCCLNVMRSGSRLEIMVVMCLAHDKHDFSIVRNSANSWKNLEATLHQGSFTNSTLSGEKKREVALRS